MNKSRELAGGIPELHHVSSKFVGVLWRSGSVEVVVQRKVGLSGKRKLIQGHLEHFLFTLVLGGALRQPGIN